MQRAPEPTVKQMALVFVTGKRWRKVVKGQTLCLGTLLVISGNRQKMKPCLGQLVKTASC